jgi:hypothetical protein
MVVLVAVEVPVCVLALLVVLLVSVVLDSDTVLEKVVLVTVEVLV